MEIKRKIEMKGKSVTFTTTTPTLLRTEVVDKVEAIKLYRQSIDEKRKHVQDINSIDKKIKELNVKKDEELEKFIEMANKAAKYAEYQKSMEQRDGMMKIVDNINEQIHDLEKAIPELKRAKK